MILKILFWMSAFDIMWSMLGYPLSLRLIVKLYKRRNLKKNYKKKPTVTVMVVAHNEEKVIFEKLNNIISINYPKDKIEFLIASDNSTDRTNSIVNKFIIENQDIRMKLFEIKNRMGKTNAQNEAQKTVKNEFLVMTDANSIMDKDSVNELISSFTSKDIAYVTGRLVIVNKDDTDVSLAESVYWNGDLSVREIESKIQTITAGNGALYACRTEEYYDFEAIKSHDSSMPLHYALKGKRAIYNKDAIVYEKAGETMSDEFGRKVRMNRNILKSILPDIRILNVFKYKWFSYFYFGHRTCRYLLWIAHILLLISNIGLINENVFYKIILSCQIIFYVIGALRAITKSENKALTFTYYYIMTVFAQWVGIYNVVMGKAKPFWEKAESTR